MMKTRNRNLNTTLVLTLSLLLAVPASIAVAADEYELDVAHTSIGFAVKHMVISTVKGSFSDFSGKIVFDEKDMTKSSVDVVIKVASINTNNQKRDEHLKSPDFFDAAKYPDITFKSNKIEKKGDGHVIHGTLTMHGVSKEVSLPFELTGKLTDPWGKVRIGADTQLEINRQDYGVSWNNTLDNGGLVVSDKVKIEISIEAVKK